mgnify:CR=1 FL=1
MAATLTTALELAQPAPGKSGLELVTGAFLTDTAIHPPAVVSVRLTLAETEALASFLAQHERLWSAHARDCGVPDPLRLPAILSFGYARGIIASE